MANEDKKTQVPQPERYAVKFRRPYPMQPGVVHVQAKDGVDAMTQGEKYCRQHSVELMSVIPDPEQ